MATACHRRSEPGRALALAAAAALWTSCLTGCQGGYQNGILQIAYYTDSRGHYPRPDCADDLFFLYKGDEYLYVDWQDIRLLRISVPQVDKGWYEMSWWDDPLGLRKGDRFHVQIESLLPPRQSKTLLVRESHPGKIALPGVGTVHVVIDETQYGKARLDRLAIDFEPAFLEQLRRMAQPPYEQVSPAEWRFVRRTILAERTTTAPTGRKRDYRYGHVKHLQAPRRGSRPSIEFTVRRREVMEELHQTTYRKEWEYWPTNPTRAGAVPMRMRPLRTVVIPGDHKETRRREYLGPEGPAVNETLIIRFDIADPPAGWKPPEFLRPRTLVTDDAGKAVLDLWPIRKQLAALPTSRIIVHFKCADDPAKAGGKVEIDRVEMVGWARVD